MRYPSTVLMPQEELDDWHAARSCPFGGLIAVKPCRHCCTAVPLSIGLQARLPLDVFSKLAYKSSWRVSKLRASGDRGRCISGGRRR
jgi:hypothetical protein